MIKESGKHHPVPFSASLSRAGSPDLPTKKIPIMVINRLVQ